MRDRIPRERLPWWMAAGLGLNTVLSLTAIGLWVTARPDIATHCPPEGNVDTPRIAAPAVFARPAAIAAHPPPPFPAPSFSSTPGSYPEPVPPAAAFVSTLQIRGAKALPPSASREALAQRTRIDPEAFAELGDTRGEVSKTTAARLERGVEAAEAAARRLGLDEGKTQSFVAVVTHGVFSLLHEELSGASGSSPRRHFEEIIQPTVDDVRLLCGEEAAEKAQELLARI